jgi:hypothetical protein
MPLIEDYTGGIPAQPVIQPRTSIAEPIAQPPQAAPTLGETVGAAFRVENMAFNAWEYLQRQDYKVDTKHNPLDVISGTRYELQYLDRFVGARNEAETRDIISRIEREERDRRTLEASGAMGYVAGGAAALFDLPTLIPGGTLAGGARMGVSAGRSALSVAGAAALSGAVSEAGIQMNQETRTAAESAANIGMATLAGAVIGALGGAMVSARSARDVKTLLSILPGDDIEAGTMLRDMANVQARSVGAATAGPRNPVVLKDERMVKALTLGGRTDPLTRTLTSDLQSARETVAGLAETALRTTRNAEFEPTALGGAVETRIKVKERGRLAVALRSLDDQFARYYFGREKAAIGDTARAGFNRLTGDQRMTFSQFKEAVSTALRNGDVHPVPEVEAATKAFRRELFDPFKTEAIGAGLLPEDVTVSTAKSYLTRVYLRELIVAERTNFKRIIVDWYEGEQKNIMARLAREAEQAKAQAADAASAAKKPAQEFQELSRQEIESIADETIDTILGTAEGRLPGLDIVAGPRGPLRERVLNIPDNLIARYLDNDVEVVARHYARTMAADVELQSRYGSVDLKEEIRKINDEANARIDAATSEKERIRINKARETAIRDIEAIRDRLRGTYGMPSNPQGMLVRSGRALRTVNYMRLLGGMTLSALPDAGAIVMRNGFIRTFRDGFLPMVTAFRNARLAANEGRILGAAVDMAVDARAMAINDVLDAYGRGSKFERGLSSLGGRFGIISIMAPWNQALKEITSNIAIRRMLEYTQQVAKGTASDKVKTFLASAGIDDTLARKIADEFGRHGKVDGDLFFANTGAWTSKEARDAFGAALVREIDRTIITPGQEKPLWMSTEAGKLIGQFKSFQFAAHHRILLSGLQERDMRVLSGFALMMALGALSYAVREPLAGRETADISTPDGLAKWGTEALDRSGVTGWLFEANNMAEKLTRGRVGASALTGETASRYASRNALGALMGPSFDLVGDAISVSGNAFAGEFTQSDLRNLRKMLPFQNLFYLRDLLNKAEAGIAEAADIPKTAAKN